MSACAIVTAALAVAACGSRASSSSSAANTPAVADADADPCGLMTTAEMSAITGDAVTGTSAHGATCTYRSAPSGGADVTVHRTDGAGQMAVARRATSLVGGVGGAVGSKGAAGVDAAAALRPGTTPAPMIGDEAIWEPNATLAVRRGNAFVEVSPPIMHDPASHPGYPLIPDTEKRRIATTIAERILVKMRH